LQHDQQLLDLMLYHNILIFVGHKLPVKNDREDIQDPNFYLDDEAKFPYCHKCMFQLFEPIQTFHHYAEILHGLNFI